MKTRRQPSQFTLWAPEQLGVAPEDITIAMLQEQLNRLRAKRLHEQAEVARVLNPEEEKKVDEFLGELIFSPSSERE